MTTSITPWTCAEPGSFAWRTCTERWPRIVDGLRSDVPAFDGALATLRDEIAGGVVAPGGDRLEGGRFAAVAAFAGQPWTSLPWYLGESFLYARVRAAVHFAETQADPFLAVKQREEASLAPDSGSAGENLESALWRSLWGNRADLSLPSAGRFTHSDDDDLVADERDAAAALVSAANVVGILLDNAGLELARDLALTRVLRGLGKRVVLFAKDVPFFVSDALIADVARTRALLSMPDDDEAVEVMAHAFFTGPGFLTQGAMPAAVVDAFAGCDVVIAKGDCNYRRLVGDGPPSDVSFESVIDFPAPLVALRTLKAEVLVGADPARVAAVRRRDVDWLVSGRCGLVQVARGANRR